MTRPLSVAILGAGPAGLAATAHLRDLTFLMATGYEQVRDLAAEGGNGRHSVPARVEAPPGWGTAA